MHRAAISRGARESGADEGEHCSLVYRGGVDGRRVVVLRVNLGLQGEGRMREGAGKWVHPCGRPRLLAVRRRHAGRAHGNAISAHKRDLCSHLKGCFYKRKPSLLLVAFADPEESKLLRPPSRATLAKPRGVRACSWALPSGILHKMLLSSRVLFSPGPSTRPRIG